MIYTGIGDNSAEIQYREDPLAREIKPDYNKLSMSAWGMPQLNDLEQFNPKMEDKADTIPALYTEYVNNFGQLKATAQEFLKLGKDITKPSLEPDVNAAHLEWLQQYNNNVKLGKELAQSRVYRDKYENNYLGKSGTWTNPIGDEVIKGLSDYAYSPETKPLEDLVRTHSTRREMFMTNNDVQSALRENEAAEKAIDEWVAIQPAQFRDKAVQQAAAYKASLKDPMLDQYKIQNLDFKKKKQAEDLGFKYATLNTKGQQVQSDYPDIVMDLINGGGQQKGQLLTGVVVGKTWANANGKDVQVDDVIQETYSAKGSDIKRQLPNTSYKKKGSDNQANIDDNAQYIVLNKTSGREVIKVKNSDGTYDKTGIQYLQSMQAPYDKKQVTPTTDFNFTPNGIVVDQSKSNKTFSKPNTSSNKTTLSVQEKKSSGIDLSKFLKK